MPFTATREPPRFTNNDFHGLLRLQNLLLPEPSSISPPPHSTDPPLASEGSGQTADPQASCADSAVEGGSTDIGVIEAAVETAAMAAAALIAAGGAGSGESAVVTRTKMTRFAIEEPEDSPDQYFQS